MDRRTALCHCPAASINGDKQSGSAGSLSSFTVWASAIAGGCIFGNHASDTNFTFNADQNVARFQNSTFNLINIANPNVDFLLGALDKTVTDVTGSDLAHDYQWGIGWSQSFRSWLENLWSMKFGKIVKRDRLLFFQKLTLPA
jgi:hypothetical protein